MTEVEAPRVETLIDLIELRAREEKNNGRGGLVMIDERERTWPVSYEELLDRSRRLARGLQAAGLKSDERVILMLPTGIEFVASFFGTLLAGGIPVPVAPPYFLNDIDDFLARFEGLAKNCRPAYLVTFKDIRLLAAGAARVTPSIRGVLLPESLSEDPEGLATVHRKPSDTCFLQYTSGSTGAPKGVEITHANVLANVHGIGVMSDARRNDVCVTWLPLYHDMGLIGALLTSLYWGAPLVLMSPQQFIKYPVRWLRAIDRFRGTCSPAPNFAYRVCLKIPDEELEGLDLSSWRIAYNGAEPVDIATMEAFVAKFARAGLSPHAPFPVYGLAEGTLAVTHPAVGSPLVVEHVDRRALQGGEAACGVARLAPPSEESVTVVSVGRPLPGMEIAIIGEDGEPRREREVGEVRVRGPSVMKGYYRNPEASDRAIRSGWLSTGDLGYVADGNLFVTGRRKDLIIKAGRNYYPQDIEDAVRAMEGVRRGGVCALGLRDPDQGTERVLVIVETRARLDDAARRDLSTRVRSLVAARVGLTVDEVEIVPPRTILRTSSGKVRRSEMRDLYARGDLLRARSRGPLPLVLALLRSIGQLALLRVRQSVGARSRGPETPSEAETPAA